MKISRIISVFVLVAVFGLTTNAQKNYKRDADIAFSGYKYYQAIEMYKKAYTKESKNEIKAEILFKIGECYRLKDDGKQAAVWYNKAIQAQYKDPIVIYYVASMYKSGGKYEEAIVEFDKYKAANPSDRKVDDEIKSCELAKEWKDNPTRTVVNPMAQINSEVYDFSPAFSDTKNKEIYFTSNRQGSMGSKISDNTGQNFSDIYKTRRDEKGKWSEPTLLNETINSEVNEGSVSLNRKKNVIYFTRCGVLKDEVSGCSIYSANKSGTKWGESSIIATAPDTQAVGHPAISTDDKVLVFASDMPGGQGGKDLWYIVYDKKAKTWSQAKNLGSEINTSADEMFPYIRGNGDLYFSSNGHKGMGGLDIFKAASTGTNQWSGVENLQVPMNSEANDFGIVFEGDKERGFFTTSRDGGKGGDDIWEFYLPPMLFSLEGVVRNVETGDAISNAKVKLIGTDGSSVVLTTDGAGNFAFAENGSDRYIKPKTSYSIVVEKEKFLIAKGKETTIGQDGSKKFFHEYVLQPISPDVVIKLPLIEYQTAEWGLQPQYKDSLNYLYNIMTENPNIVIQLRSHTDHRGSVKANQVLSQKRAQSCVDYLVKEKGIHPDRIIAIGMGENEPMKGAMGTLLDETYIKALKTKEDQDVALQRNRRTDFKVVRTDFVQTPVSGTSED